MGLKTYVDFEDFHGGENELDPNILRGSVFGNWYMHPVFMYSEKLKRV